MIWTITTYYNPQKYTNRYKNFKTFSKNIQTPLLVVEFSNTGEFELTKEDSTILVQIPKGDILWQKERLLNPNIGTNVPANIFNNSEDAKVEMETEIRLAFAKQLPLLRLIDLIISTDNFTNQATIEISYSLPNRQQTSLTIGFVYIEGNNPPYQEIL